MPCPGLEMISHSIMRSESNDFSLDAKRMQEAKSKPDKIMPENIFDLR